MSQTVEQIEGAIREAAGSQKMDLSLSENAYVVSKKTPWGWNLYGHRDLESAVLDGGHHVSEANIDVYILDSRGLRLSLIAVLQ